MKKNGMRKEVIRKDGMKGGEKRDVGRWTKRWRKIHKEMREDG